MEKPRTEVVDVKYENEERLYINGIAYDYDDLKVIIDDMSEALIESHLTLKKVGEFNGVKYEDSYQKKMIIKSLLRVGVGE